MSTKGPQERSRASRSRDGPVMRDWDLWEVDANKACARFCSALLASGRIPATTPMMFCCVPLRTAVFLSAAWTVTLSAFYICAREVIEDKIRIFSGGYALQSQVISEIVEYSALLWGSFGMVGVLYCKSPYIRVFLYYQYVRLFAWFLMYYTDVPLLFKCELWRKDAKLAAEQFGWNDVMYRISLSNRCPEERALFTILSTLTLLLFVYTIGGTQRLLTDIEEEPRYLLRIPKDHPSGAFYTHSLASRSYINAEKKKELTDGVDQVGAPVGVNPFVKGDRIGPPGATRYVREPAAKADPKEFIWDPFKQMEDQRKAAKNFDPFARKMGNAPKTPPKSILKPSKEKPPPWYGVPGSGPPVPPPWAGGPPMSWSAPPWVGGAAALDDPMPPPPPGSGLLWGLPERTRQGINSPRQA